MTKDRHRPRLTHDQLGWLASKAKSLLRDMDGTNEGRRWKTILEWAQEMLEAPEENTQGNGKGEAP